MAFKIKEAILGVSITILFVFFIFYGIKAFYKEPKYENFCKIGDQIDVAYSEGHGYYYSYPARIKEPNGADTCLKPAEAYEKFRKDCLDKKQDVIYEYDSNGCQVPKSCTSCNKEFRNSLNIYNRNVFIITGIVGILVIIIGAVLHITSVSAGLFGGGVLTIIYGTTNYWSELGDLARFIILGITLAVLIYLGYKGFSFLGFGKEEKTKKKR